MMANPVIAPRRSFLQSVLSRQHKAVAAQPITSPKRILVTGYDPNKSLVSMKMEAMGKSMALTAYRVPKPETRHRIAVAVDKWHSSTRREDRAALRGYRRGISHRPPRKNWAHSPAEMRLTSHPRIFAPIVQPKAGGGVWISPAPHPKGVGVIHRGRKTPTRLGPGVAGR
jgi:hypothetical protein